MELCRGISSFQLQHPIFNPNAALALIKNLYGTFIIIGNFKDGCLVEVPKPALIETEFLLFSPPYLPAVFTFLNISVNGNSIKKLKDFFETLIHVYKRYDYIYFSFPGFTWVPNMALFLHFFFKKTFSFIQLIDYFLKHGLSMLWFLRHSLCRPGWP